MSGVVPTDKCKEEFTLLKNSRTYKFIVFKIDESGKYVDVLQTHKTSVSCAVLPAPAPRSTRGTPLAPPRNTRAEWAIRRAPSGGGELRAGGRSGSGANFVCSRRRLIWGTGGGKDPGAARVVGWQAGCLRSIQSAGLVAV